MRCWVRSRIITGPDIMNYINKLQEDNAELRGELESAYSMALELKVYAMSPKFMGESGWGGKTYIAKEDVIRFAENILGEMPSVVLTN